jgi:ferredoxin-NADP reductase
VANPIKLKCTVSSIINHDDAVSTIVLKPSRRLPNFKPGQFLHLALDPFDPTIGFWPESRVFSIASTPRDSAITIAYAVKGAFTKRMKDDLTVSKEVWIRLPYGHFNLAAAPDAEVILIAGGTGITPFISFLLNEMHQPTDTALELFYGVRRSEIFLFTDILTQAMSQLEGFRLQAFCETDCSGGNRFPVEQGSLSLGKIWQAVDNPLQATFYLSGPAAMINNFKKDLLGRGVNPEKIRIDEWE